MLFSDYFRADKNTVKQYGAVDISFLSDTPLLIDPLLIYSNDDDKIKALYGKVAQYLLFLNYVSKMNLDQKQIN